MGEGEVDLLVGRVVAGKYAVQSVIGQGAMGVVYRAKQIKLEKIVALKVLSDAIRNDPEFVQRFHTEARAASRLDHPHSTRVLDFGEDESGMLYIAMELLDGRTLGDLLAREFPLPAARVASILSQTLSAVGAAHALKILHRDLKPENIVVLEGRDDEDRPIDVVKVCDFGIAKLDATSDDEQKSTPPPSALSPPTWNKSKTATRAGVIVGTPQYMSPEQARAEKLDVRSDLYSLGVVMYEMLTSRAPFDEGTPAEVLAKHVAVNPAPPSTLWPGTSPELEAICMRALKKNPDERWASAREMRAALRPLLDASVQEPSVPVERTSGNTLGVRVDAPTISATAMALEPKKKRSRVAIIAPLALVAAGGITFAVYAKSKPKHVAAIAVSPSATLASAPQTATTALAQLVESPVPTSPTTPTTTPTTTTHHTHIAHPKSSAPEVADTTPTFTVVEAPPPATTTAPIVTAAMTSTATIAPPIVHADPARVRVELGAIRADRVTVTSVENAMRHVDFTSCYRSEVSQQREADGNATLSIEMDEERVARAELVGGSFAPSLRACVARRAIGTSIPSADTGGASAKVTLRFFLR